MPTYEFGPFVLDAAERRLTRDGRRVAVPAKAWQILVMLVEAGGRLVPHEAFRAKLWSDVVVEDRTLTVHVSTLRKALGADPVDGYIGLAVINKFLTTVDYGLKSFELTRDKGRVIDLVVAVDPNVLEFPMRVTSSGFLSSEVTLDGVNRPLNFIVDTGASISVLSASLLKTENFSTVTRTGRMRVFGAAGVADDVETLLLPRLTVGPSERAAVRAVVLDLEPLNETAGFIQNGIIGGNFLRHYRVTFDFARRIVQLAPEHPVKVDKEEPPVRPSGAAIS